MSDSADALARAQQRIAELEAKLRENEPRMRLFEGALDLMCVAGIDGYFKQVNSFWTTVLGWTVEELTSTPFIEFVHPDDVAATHTAVDRLAHGSEITSFQNRYRHRDGTYRRLSWNAVFDATQMAILSVARDVTEVYATREALRASEAAYKQLFDGMLDGFSYHDMIFDRAGEPQDYRFRAVNPAFEEMTGLCAANLVGRRVLEVLPATEKHWIDTFGAVAKTGVPVRYENYSQAFDKWFEVLAFRPGDGQFACTFHDITARKRAEDERAQLQAQVEYTQKLESLGILAGGIAHDFNNLLMVILGNIELASCGLSGELAMAREDLAAATSAGERARDLCQQMLAYAGKADPHKAPFDLTVLTREILPLATPTLSKKVRLHAEFPDAPLTVQVDRSQLTQVIMNLIINASDAIGDVDGEISVRTGVSKFADSELMSFTDAGGLASGVYAFVEVADTGVGMTRETLARIFDPFFTTKATGRGLGLAATLGIVRAHHGGMLVESEPGRGSRFLCALPLLTEAVFAIEEPPVRIVARAGTVLVVDDEPAVRRIAARMLNSLGFDVLEASDGAQALDFLSRDARAPTAVLLDMAMPKMSGLDVLPLLREQRKDLPIVLMSGYDEGMLAGGVSDESLVFLKKPFRREQLAAALGTLLEPRRASA